MEGENNKNHIKEAIIQIHLSIKNQQCLKLAGHGGFRGFIEKKLKRKTASSNKWTFFGYGFNKALIHIFSDNHGNLNMN